MFDEIGGQKDSRRDAEAFEQTEEEALRLLRLPASEITEETRQEGSVGKLV